jgi:hypothetical protein
VTKRASFLIAALALVGSSPASAVTKNFEIIVPAYFYPSFSGSDWDRMTAAAASGVKVTAIMNPGSGPGTETNSDYVAAVSKFRTAGGKVLGYVPSGYIGQQVNAGASCQPAAGSTYTSNDVVACAGLYQSLYNVDGVFIDEMGAPAVGAPTAAVVTFYDQVYDGIKAINAAWTITGNPGTDAPEGLLRTGDSGGADSLLTFENRASEFGSAVPAAYTANYDASRFGALLLETDPNFNIRAALAQAAARNIGQIYFTDDRLPNPYDVLPTYWDAEVAAIREFNTTAVPEPAIWLMQLVGLTAVGVAKRRQPAGLRQRKSRALQSGSV